MKKNYLNETEELFRSECRTIELKYLYDNYTSVERFVIFTDLTKEELMAKYPNIITEYMPFIVLPKGHGEVFDEYRRIEDKYEKCTKNNHSKFSIDDGLFEIHHPECAIECDIIDEMEKREKKEKIYKYIDYLDDTQRRRLIKRYFKKESYTKIAKDEGVSRTAVTKSINNAIENIRQYFAQDV